MKTSEVPQDFGIESGTKRLHVAIDDNDKFVMVQSVGWSATNDAFGVYWEHTQKKLAEVHALAQNNLASPLQYHMMLKLMDEKFLAAYAGFFVWQTRRHLKPAIFKKLKPGVLKKYADVLGLTIEQLVTLPKRS